jgi:hypothetical protein
VKKLIVSAMTLLLVCAPAAQAKGRKHRGKYAMNPQMQQLKAQQKAERQACKREGGAGCADLKQTQKEQRRELKQQLRSMKGK